MLQLLKSPEFYFSEYIMRLYCVYTVNKWNWRLKDPVFMHCVAMQKLYVPPRGNDWINSF